MLEHNPQKAIVSEMCTETISKEAVHSVEKNDRQFTQRGCGNGKNIYASTPPAQVSNRTVETIGGYTVRHSTIG